MSIESTKRSTRETANSGEAAHADNQGCRHNPDDCLLQTRLGSVDWTRVVADLDGRGFAVVPALLNPLECESLVEQYDDDQRYRSRIVMAAHSFGQGEYKYFAYPLPDLVDTLRMQVYPYLAPLARKWMQIMGRDPGYPDSLVDWLARCHEMDQPRPTPLILRYVAGDYNCLHQDLYGDCWFPLQLAVVLSRPGADFEGGEFVLTEQRPRMQSRVQVVPLLQGDAVIFAVNERPLQGTRGHYRVRMRHGVSGVRKGARYTLGIIFHDAS